MFSSRFIYYVKSYKRYINEVQYEYTVRQKKEFYRLIKNTNPNLGPTRRN